MKRFNQLLILLFIISLTTASCGIFGKSQKEKACMCPSRKVVG